MACYPAIPVKQMIADLAANSTSGKGPAAIFVENASWDDEHGGVEVVTYGWVEVIYYSNAGSPRFMKMLEGYEKAMDGQEVFGDRFVDDDEEEDHQEGAEPDHENGVDEMTHSVTRLLMHKEEVDEVVQNTDSANQDASARVVFEPANHANTSHGKAEGMIVAENQNPNVHDGEDDVVCEDEDKAVHQDSTKGISGFSWLKDMEIWARLE